MGGPGRPPLDDNRRRRPREGTREGRRHGDLLPGIILDNEGRIA